MSASRFYWLQIKIIRLAKLVNVNADVIPLARLTLFCHRYDDVIIDYRINFFNPINLFVDVKPTSISLAITNFMFCHRYDDLILGLFSDCPLRCLLLIVWTLVCRVATRHSTCFQRETCIQVMPTMFV